MNRKLLVVVVLLLGVIVLSERTSINHNTIVHASPSDWAELGQYASANRSIPEGRIIFFGDSITERWDLSSNKSYVNRGISAQITPQMVARFRQDVLDLRPKIVVILAGTNDARGIGYPVPIETTKSNIQTMVELAMLHGVRPILCSIPPMGHQPMDSSRDPVEEVSELNSWLRFYAEQKKITFVDYFTPMFDSDGDMKPALTDDGIHPNREGYAVMRPLVDSAIEKQ